MKIQFAEMPPEKIIFILVIILAVLILGAFCVHSKANDIPADLPHWELVSEEQTRSVLDNYKMTKK
jgi:hemolysin-activating ACP:hemolysin acyltransferase